MDDDHSQHSTIAKMLSFQQLPVGWHYGEGRPCVVVALLQALYLHRYAQILGLTETDAFPGIDGALLLTVYDGDDTLAFQCELDGSISYVLERNDLEVAETEDLTMAQARTILYAHVMQKSCPGSY